MDDNLSKSKIGRNGKTNDPQTPAAKTSRPSTTPRSPTPDPPSLDPLLLTLPAWQSFVYIFGPCAGPPNLIEFQSIDTKTAEKNVLSIAD